MYVVKYRDFFVGKTVLEIKHVWFQRLYVEERMWQNNNHPAELGGKETGKFFLSFEL